MLIDIGAFASFNVAIMVLAAGKLLHRRFRPLRDFNIPEPVASGLLVSLLLGRDYQAAVLCPGFGGFSMGATPTAMANMAAVTQTYGPAAKAFLILPLVSGFFVDISNSLVIQRFVDWLG